MVRKLTVVLILACAVCVWGCKNDVVVEEVPVREIEPSEPPAFEPPVKQESRYGADGVFKIAEKKYFGAVAPYSVREVSCNKEECQLIVPRMNAGDVEHFLEKYFPYQELEHFVNVNVYELYPKIKEEYKGDGIVPELDPNVIKPSEKEAVSIRVYWNKREYEYVWIYRNPSTRYVQTSPDAVPEPEIQEILSEEEMARRDFKYREESIVHMEKELGDMESQIAELKQTDPVKASQMEMGIGKLKSALEETRKTVDAERSKYE